VPTSNLTLNTLFNLSYGTFTGAPKLQRTIEDAVNRGVQDGSKKGSKKAGEEATKSWLKVYEAMTKAGLTRQAAAFRQEIAEKLRSEKEIAKKERLLRKELETTQDEARKRAIQEERAHLKNLLSQEKKERLKMEQIADKRAKERMKLISDYEEKMNKTRNEKMQEAGENFKSLIGGAFSADNLSLEDLTETLGKGLAGGLGNMAGAIGSAGGAGTSAFAALASSAAALAAVVGPLAALAGAMAMAYNQTKEMNKEILDASSAFDLGGVEAGKFKENLAKIRLEVVDVAFGMRLSKDETMAAAKAMSEAGITFREFRDISRGAKDEFVAFQDVLRSSLSAAYGLGIEVSQVAEFYNKMSRDLGYNLDQIEGSFGLIAEQAQLAGMRTKDFFGAVNEASTGMALYNFRIGDTATLFTELVKILGEDLAKQKIGLEGTFKNMGMQEKYKQVLLGGSKFSGAVKADMKEQAKAFAESLKGTAGAEGLKIKGRGIIGAGGAIDTKTLASMTGKSFREALESSGLNDVQKRQLQSLRKLSKAEKGGMGIAEASGALSKRGELAAQMAQGSAMFGGRLLSDLSGVERMMAEEVTGRSGEEYDTLARIQESMMAQFEQMKKSTDPKIQAQIQGKTFEEAIVQGLLTASEEDVSKVTNKRHFSEVEKAAREQLKESRSISQTISNAIQQLLSRIALGVELMASYLGADKDGRAEQTSKSIARQEELSKAIEDLDKSIGEKKFSLDETTDAAEREKLSKELMGLSSEKERKSRALKEEQEVQRGIVRGESEEVVRNRMLREQFGNKLDTLTPAQLRDAGLGKFVRTEKSAGAYGDTGRYGGRTYGEDKEVVDLKNISIEERDILEDMFKKEEERDEALKQADLDQKIRDEAAAKQSKEEHGELIKTLQIMDQASAIRQLSSYLGLTEKEVQDAMKGEKATLASIQSRLEEGEGGFTEAEKILASGTGFPLEFNKPVKDFVYRGDGTRGSITPIDRADEFYGAKPGGAIDQALRGTGKSVVININGGDEGRVYSIVKRILTETGYSGMKSY
jgi:hypothetical protein